MSGVNEVIILGNLGRDPEVRTFQNGGKIANLSVATSETWKDKATGERKERTEWHSVVIQGDGLVRVVEQYLSKGSKVYLRGKLQTRKWQDQSGADRFSTEIVVGISGQLMMLDGQGGGNRDAAPAQDGGYGAGGRPSDDLGMEEIPFACEWRI